MVGKSSNWSLQWLFLIQLGQTSASLFSSPETVMCFFVCVCHQLVNCLNIFLKGFLAQQSGIILKCWHLLPGETFEWVDGYSSALGWVFGVMEKSGFIIFKYSHFIY